MPNLINDTRQTLRVQLRSHSNLTTADDHYAAHIVNLSESGVLIAVIEPHQLCAGEAISLDIELDGKKACMEGHIAHIKEHMVGLDCAPKTDEDAKLVEAAIDRLLHLNSPKAAS